MIDVKLLIALILACAMSFIAPLAADASEVKPFEITKFTMQTTGPTRETFDEATPSTPWEFVNEPSAFTQAGGHPYALTTTIEIASEEVPTSVGEAIYPTRDPKDIVVSLPPGLLGDPLAVAHCSLTQLLAHVRCPPSTQVGVFRLRWFGGTEALGPIVNVTPEVGQSAEFALENQSGDTFLETAHLVRTGQGYGLTVVSNNIPSVHVSRIEETFWGVPADPSHTAMRGRECQTIVAGSSKMNCEVGLGGLASGEAPVPFLDWPTDCSAGAQTARLRGDSWEEPGHLGDNQVYEGYREATAVLPGVTGCNALAFAPSLEVQPDTLLADEPTGLGVSIKVPQPETQQTNVTPHLRDAVVTLPEGMSISPGVVDGVRACEASGPEGINFTGPESEEVGLSGELQLAPGHCPGASTIGTAEAITPLLGSPVKGHVYLARPGCGGVGQAACTDQDALDGNLYQLYLELGGTGEFADAGIQIKVPGYVEANPATGQLTTKFLENPQTPFSELKIHLNGGPRASIDNPAACGPAATTADFTPWSAPGVTPEGLSMLGTADATPSSFFDVEGCANPPDLRPGFVAGTVSPQAGRFTAFTLNLTREDREQFFKGVQVHTPPGLLGMLSSVPLCEETLANAGHCPEASKIGTTTVASGAGSHPFEISGSVYLTKSYRGAPFGLSIVTDAVAGPFNLGLVVVRARIDVDPETSALTITTDESGPYAVPQIIFGVPLRLQRITVDIDRPGFMFNPTNCAAQQVTATISGSEEALANVATPFAAASCKSLAFKPAFTVSTSAHTSRLGGASLDAKLSYPAGSVGSEANIARVKVELPKQLPSRLSTLQKACSAATFASNPAGCPAASIVGAARARTPLLPVGLAGPVYFVSHGGEAFPSLVVVLQGEGVRVDLTGSTFISKAGITSSTFKTVPDVPVSTFELYLPEGPYSALAANANLCARTKIVTGRRRITKRVRGRTVHRTVTTRTAVPASLLMPTEMTAQSGAVIKQSTKIEVIGCGTTAAKTRQKHRSARASKSSDTGTGRGRTHP
ncbi:MAG TPA: hypothetical protein VGL57_02005 [Solirubrobacteraceae bacterium]|jgi:hypothetical protein